MKEVKIILDRQSDFLKYMKSKFTLIHLSNVFFRDVHYGVMDFLRDQGMKLKYIEAEEVARQVCSGLEQAGVLKKIDHQSWLLTYPEFALPRQEKVVEKKQPQPSQPVAQKT